MSTTLASAALRNHQEESLWHRLRRQRGDLPTPRDGDVWRVGAASVEAAALFRLLRRGNGDTVESLRQLIAVSPADKRELMEWAALSSPTIAVRIEAMVAYREEVLAAFDHLVENEHKRASAAAD